MDADRKLLRAKEAIALIAEAHDVPEKEVRRHIAELRKIVDHAEASIPDGRKRYAERMAAEAERKAKIREEAQKGAA